MTNFISMWLYLLIVSYLCGYWIKDASEIGYSRIKSATMVFLIALLWPSLMIGAIFKWLAEPAKSK